MFRIELLNSPGLSEEANFRELLFPGTSLNKGKRDRSLE
jgi:hypothetical protein